MGAFVALMVLSALMIVLMLTTMIGARQLDTQHLDHLLARCSRFIRKFLGGI